MIAHIIPIKRVQKHITFFDYLVPEALTQDIRIGQLVSIPLRNTVIFGIVFSLSKKPEKQEYEVKEIGAIIHNTPLVSRQYLHIIRILSAWYGLAMGTVLLLALLPMQKRKLKSITLKNIPPYKKKEKPSSKLLDHFSYENKKEHGQKLQKLCKKQTLILVPKKSLMAEVFESLTKEQQKHTAFWHSDLTKKEQFSTWLKIRNGEVDNIIGTRSAILLPFFSLKHIVIDYEYDEQHKHWDQTPRFYTKDIALLIQQIYSIPITYSGCSVSLAEFARGILPQKPKETPTIIDMRSQRNNHNYSVFSTTVEEAIITAKDDVFLFLNRRGYATSYGCRDCGFTFSCTSCKLPFIYHEKSNTLQCHYCKTSASIVFTCPKCASSVVKLKGAGTELVETQVRNSLPEKHNHAIVRIDADVNDTTYTDEKKPRILIGTEKALPFIRWDKTQHIVFIHIDQQLVIPEFSAQTHMWHMIQDVLFRKKPTSSFYIQTMNPEHILFQSLADPIRFYTHENTLRKRFNYPPHTYITRYFYGHQNAQKAKEEAENVYHILTQTLTKAQKDIILERPYDMHPKYYRGKYWFCIIARMNNATWKNDLIWLNRYIPRLWRIDPHPISLLSP